MVTDINKLCVVNDIAAQFNFKPEDSGNTAMPDARDDVCGASLDKPQGNDLYKNKWN